MSVLRQKGRGRTKDQSGTDFCLVVLPAALFLFMKSLLRATDEPQVQPLLLQTASSTREEEMTPNLARRSPSLPARPAARRRAESKASRTRRAEHRFLSQPSKGRQMHAETTGLKRIQGTPPGSGRVMGVVEPTAHLEMRLFCHGIPQGFS